MDDASLLSSMFDSLRASLRLGAKGATDTYVIELDGVTASVVPAAPDRSVVNSVVYDSPPKLEASLDELAAAYEDAGVRAWTVWVPDRDESVVALLEAAGHKLDASPTAMGMELDQLRDASGPEPEWSGVWDLRTAVGRPVYERIGYRDLGPVHMYERRAAKQVSLQNT